MGEDLLLQLLLILPPKTLMRFKGVSKWWCALISSPEFVVKHLSNSEHNNLSSCVLFRRSTLIDTGTSNDTGLQFSLLNFFNDNYDNDNDRNGDGEHSFLSSVEDIDAPISMTNDLNPKGESLHIIGHCGGIICVEANSGELFLWNPAIEESRLLPPEPCLPKWDAPAARSYYPIHEFLEAIGFGYDPKSNDYKVINIGFQGTKVYGDPDGFDMIVYPPRAVVYTLGSDTWREIETDSLETETTNLWPESFQIYFDGMCYWLGHEQNKVVNGWDLTWEEYMRHVVILFDTCDEVFHDILLPKSLNNCSNMRLIVWDKSIALFGLHYNAIHICASFGIWVMDEFGGRNNAWTKHLTFDLTEIARPLAFLKSDEILMVSEDEDERMFSYNLSTKTFKYLPIQRVPSSFGAATFSRSYFVNHTDLRSMVVIYVRSLVSVARSKTLRSREFSNVRI